MEITLPEVEKLTREIAELRKEVSELKEKIEPSKAWYTRADLARLKNLKTSAFYQKSWLLPAGEKTINGISMWPRAAVLPWLSMSDEDLRSKK